jgi:hypothetical protein
VIIPVLIYLQRVVDGTRADNDYYYHRDIVKGKGLDNASIAQKLFCFKVDGVSVF